MAAPAEVTIKTLSGKYVMNKTLSDDSDAVLSLQGVGWLTRKAIGVATIVLTIKQYEKDGATHIDIISDASGLSSTLEERTLDYSERGHTDKIFGTVKGRSKFVTLSTYEPSIEYSPEQVEFLKAKTLKDLKTPSQFESEDVILSYVKNQDKGYGWTAEQIWGFETINGARHYTRRVIVKTADGKKAVLARLVYDYKGPVESTGEDGLAYGE